jgi:two-component system phosphate regulon response regulator PhoB
MEKKVLIIEDDEGTAEILELIVTGLHCEAITSTYALPVKEVEAVTPDLILLDHLLGDQLGGELCLKLKENVRTKNIPIIMVSAHYRVKEVAKQFCADDYIEKPFSIDDMEKMIKKYLH